MRASGNESERDLSWGRGGSGVEVGNDTHWIGDLAETSEVGKEGPGETQGNQLHAFAAEVWEPASEDSTPEVLLRVPRQSFCTWVFTISNTACVFE